MRRLAATLACALLSAHGAAAAVIFVDADHPGGAGTADRPFATIAEAQRVAVIGSVIYVAEASKPYEENVTLTRGEMLVGSAYGLDAVRDELHVTLDAPPSPAMQGTGPVIHGNVSLTGENVIAGCTIVADKTTGAALTAENPQGKLTIRRVWIRTTDDVYGFYVGEGSFGTSWIGGGLTATNHGSGVLVSGGVGDVSFEDVAIGGSFASGIEIRNRRGGAVTFRNRSSIKLSDVSRLGVSITASAGSVAFDSPLQIATTSGRAFVVDRAGKLAVTGGSSWIEAAGQALDVRDTSADVAFHHISGAGGDAFVIDKLSGRFSITGDGEPASGGTIATARITQSRGMEIHDVRWDAVHLRHLEVSSFDDSAIGSLTAGNITDVKFDGVDFAGAAQIQEARGTIVLSRSVLRGFAFEQRFNTAALRVDGCTATGPLTVKAFGGALNFAIRDSVVDSVDVSLADVATGCFAAERTTFAGPVRLTAAGQSRIRTAADSAAFAASNRGAVFVASGAVTPDSSGCGGW